MSLSMELVTFVSSTVLGGAMKLWSMSLEAKKQQALTTLSLIKEKAAGFAEAADVVGTVDFPVVSNCYY